MTGQGSRLETVTAKVWDETKSAGNFSRWQVGGFSPDLSPLPGNNKAPTHLPAVRCYLGETSTYLYKGKSKTALLKEWLQELVGFIILTLLAAASL